jgi:hypothetical protein
LRLRYLGAIPTTFVTLGLEVQPGDEFDVDDATASAFTARADVEAVDPPKSPRRKTKADAAPDPVPAGATPDPTVEEVSSGVSDDH